MSQFSIMRFGSAGEMAGENMPPPPERPTGSHELGLDSGLAGVCAEPVAASSPSSPSTLTERRRILKNAGHFMVGFCFQRLDKARRKL